MLGPAWKVDDREVQGAGGLQDEGAYVLALVDQDQAPSSSPESTWRMPAS